MIRRCWTKYLAKRFVGSSLPLVDYRADLLGCLGAYVATGVVSAVASGYAIRIAEASGQTLIHLGPALLTAGTG